MPAVADDLLSPAASADPYPLLRALREAEPVHWSEAHRAWLITRYDDVSAAFQNKALSSDRVRPLLAARTTSGVHEDQPTATTAVLGLIADWMVVSDPPAHTRLRKLAAGAFKGQRIAGMTELITRIVDEQIDAFLADPGPDRGSDAGPGPGPGPQDLIERVAYPLPATVIAMMLGAGPDDRDRFRAWSDELALVAFGTGGAARAERHERALRGLTEMQAYFRELIDERRRAPGEDMLSALMARDGSDRLSDDELVAMCALLLFAGHETTTNSIANAVLALLRRPDQLDRLRREPELIGPAVEELLRYLSIADIAGARVAARDFAAGGQLIHAGDGVIVANSLANRDPAVFADPDRFDITRGTRHHVAFGYGVHQCLGQNLARAELEIALPALLNRLPGLRLAVDVERLKLRDGGTVQGVNELMITWGDE